MKLSCVNYNGERAAISKWIHESEARSNHLSDGTAKLKFFPLSGDCAVDVQQSRIPKTHKGD